MDWLIGISLLLENHYYPILILLTFIALAFSKYRRSLIVSLILVILLVGGLKGAFQEARPCSQGGTLTDCNDFELPVNAYGFPSGHSSTSILLAAATLGTYAFVFFLPLAFLVSFTRIVIGVHSLNQIVAGMALALAVFFIFQKAHLRQRKDLKNKEKLAATKEVGRQLIHIFIGFAIIALLLWVGKDGQDSLFATEMLLLGLLFSGMLLINAKMLGLGIGPFEWVIRRFERREALFPGRGALLYLVGGLLIISFIYVREPATGLAVIAIFATGDGFSTIFGRRFGKNKLPWNVHKSWEGMAAFFVSSSIVAYPFIGLMAIPYSAALSVIETLDFQIDDNLLLPLAAIALNWVFGRII